MSTIQLADRVQRIKPSPTLAVTGRAQQLKAAGKDVIGLAAGEPDFDTPDHVKAAAIAAIQSGFTKYTAVDGIPELKQAVVDKFARDNSLEFSPPQILVSAGAKHSIFNLAQALLEPGDEVIIPAPYWVSYPDIIMLAGATPRIVETDMEQGFKMQPAQLEAAINAQTRLLILNSPSNPTGSVYSRMELAALGEVLRGHPQVLIASDDIYEHILWGDEPFTNIANACPDLQSRILIVNGVSKAYAMTGWRIGYAAGPVEAIAAMKKIQSQSTSNPTSIAQVAAAAALSGDQACVQTMVAAFHERHERILQGLNRLAGVRCIPAQGAFYAFADFSGAIERTPGVDNDVEMAEYLLDRCEVAVVPGSAFGCAGHERLSFATSMELLDAALDRLEKVLGRSAEE